MDHDTEDVFNNEGYLKIFERERIVPMPMRSWYAWDMLRRIPPTRRSRVLDAGAGTGQFAEPILSTAALIEQDIELYVMDSSESMCERLRQLNLPGVTSVRSNILTMEGYGDTFDAILVSEVLHLFDSMEQVLGSLRKALVDVGTLFIRIGTQQQVQARSWYKWYPEAHRIDMERSPTRDGLSRALFSAGFDVSVSVVDESRWLPRDQFRDLLASRGFSSFRMIDETVHRKQSECMTRDTSSSTEIWFDYEMSWFAAKVR